MNAREYVEWMAYQAIEDAAMEHHERRIFRRSHTTAAPPTENPQHGPSKGLIKSASCVDQGFEPGADHLAQDVHRRLHISRTCSNLQNGDATNDHTVHQHNHGMMRNVKKRLSDNFEHYSNIFHEVALPLLFRKGRSRSRSRSRDKRDQRDQNSNPHITKNGQPFIEEGYDIVEHIELHHMNDYVFSSHRERGQGHNFIPVLLESPTWCDKCGDFIWGVYKQCLRCTHCEYTCHNKCRQGVSLDCATSGQPESKPAVERQSRKQETVLAADQSSAQAVICSPSTVWFFKRSPSRRNWLLDLWGSRSKQKSVPEDDADSGYHTGSSTLTSRGPRGAKRPPGEWTLTREDLRRNIETFNNNNHGLIMSLQQDTNTFQGFIRVHMNLIRPINMSLSLRPPSIYDVIGQGEEEDEHNDGTHTTSFYLPKDTTKVIHINSDTTAQEVIKALLSKFKITDNPRKFALYERLEESSNKATMRRLEDEECPLPLCLCWTADGVEGLDCRRYVLQENDTGEIMWEAFSLPELENFLKILNREEEEYVEQVKGKYRMLKIHMQRRLVELDNKPTEETTLTDDKRRPVFV